MLQEEMSANRLHALHRRNASIVFLQFFEQENAVKIQRRACFKPALQNFQKMAPIPIAQRFQSGIKNPCDTDLGLTPRIIRHNPLIKVLKHRFHE
jgi:hypothetical protein